MAHKLSVSVVSLAFRLNAMHFTSKLRNFDNSEASASVVCKWTSEHVYIFPNVKIPRDTMYRKLLKSADFH